MVEFRTSDSRPILSRGPAPGLRFFFYAMLSLTLMWLDQRHDYLKEVRLALSLVSAPLHTAIDTPGSVWDWTQDSFKTRKRLSAENASLHKQLRAANIRVMRLEALEQENLRLRSMREATAGIADRYLVAEIMRVDLNPFRHRVIINKGLRDDVFKGQTLLDATGVVGQITRVGVFTSEAILISDAEHAIPVQVNRNGLRTIALGTGDLARLSLPFLPTNADIQKDDLLVTSGLGEVFPAGYPVGKVTEINKSAGSLAEITAEPAATLDRDREVLLVWLKPQPQEPAGSTATAAPSTGAAPASTKPAANTAAQKPPASKPAERRP